MITDQQEHVLYASHHQFYVQDIFAPADSGLDFRSPTAFENHLAVTKDTLAVGTGSFGSVKVVVEIHDSEPALDLDNWDHVTEAGLTLASKILAVFGCLSGSGLFFKVHHEHWCVRCCHANLKESVDCGEGGDWYLLQLWPAHETSVRALKRWQPVPPN